MDEKSLLKQTLLFLLAGSPAVENRKPDFRPSYSKESAP